jgi:hypothetical protein
MWVEPSIGEIFRPPRQKKPAHEKIGPDTPRTLPIPNPLCKELDARSLGGGGGELGSLKP